MSGLIVSMTLCAVCVPAHTGASCFVQPGRMQYYQATFLCENVSPTHGVGAYCIHPLA